jgi:cysteine-rich repeat protein
MTGLNNCALNALTGFVVAVVLLLASAPAFAGFDAEIVKFTTIGTKKVGHDLKLKVYVQNLSTLDSGYNGEATFCIFCEVDVPWSFWDVELEKNQSFGYMDYIGVVMPEFELTTDGKWNFTCEVRDSSCNNAFYSKSQYFMVEEACDDECDSGDEECLSSGTRRYCDQDADGCWAWQTSSCSGSKVCWDGECVSNGEDDYCHAKDEWGGGCSHEQFDCDSDSECSGSLQCKGAVFCLGFECGCCYAYEEWDSGNNECYVPCDDQCDSGDAECLAAGTRRYCVEDADGCWDWKTVSCGGSDVCWDGQCIGNGEDDFCHAKEDWNGGCTHEQFDCDTDSECLGLLQCKGALLCLGFECGCCFAYEEWDSDNNECYVPCDDQCNSGEEECLSSGQRRYCVDDADGCWDWKTVSCSGSDVCWKGECLDDGHDDYCKAKKDWGGGCGYGESDCDWVMFGSECLPGLECLGPFLGGVDGCCLPGEVWSGTECINCDEECESGETKCKGSAQMQTCVKQNGCWVWETEACPLWQQCDILGSKECEDKTCPQFGVDEAELTGMDCDSVGEVACRPQDGLFGDVAVCMDLYGVAQCWSVTKECASDEVCQDGVCVEISGSDCWNVCDPACDPTVLLPVPYFEQHLTPWCAYTSLTMLARYYGVDALVWEVAGYFGQSSEDGSDTSEMEDEFPLYLADHGLQAEAKSWEAWLWETWPDDLDDYIMSRLEAGHPVLIGVSDEEHAIVITGYTPEFIFVHDPSGASVETVYGGSEIRANVPFSWEEFHDLMQWDFFGFGDEAITVSVLGQAGPGGELLTVQARPAGWSEEGQQYVDVASFKFVRLLEDNFPDTLMLRWNGAAKYSYDYLPDIPDFTTFEPIPGDDLGYSVWESDQIGLTVQVHNAGTTPADDLEVRVTITNQNLGEVAFQKLVEVDLVECGGDDWVIVLPSQGSIDDNPILYVKDLVLDKSQVGYDQMELKVELLQDGQTVDFFSHLFKVDEQDVIPPVLELGSPPDGSWHASPLVDVSGSVTDDTGVAWATWKGPLEQEGPLVPVNGQWMVPGAALQPGWNEFQVEAGDFSKNMSVLTFSLEYCPNGICTGSCGNDVCETEKGESCVNCSDDCDLCCGNGSLEIGEQCDPPVLAACKSYQNCLQCQCTGSPPSVCGNGKLEALEECEQDDDCPAADQCVDCVCVFAPPQCGNGLVDAGEECDLVNGGMCEWWQKCIACKCAGAPPAKCGNGTIEAQEECEVDADCGGGHDCVDCLCFAVDPVCGDGHVEEGEQCESNDVTACAWYEDCVQCLCEGEPPAVCGNNHLEVGEDCEADQDCPVGQMCKQCNCVQPPAACGNHVLNAGEQCDPPFVEACALFETCQACQCAGLPPAQCGNGILEPGELCEADADCGKNHLCVNCECISVQEFCGDGMVGDDEECDPPELAACTWYQTCVDCTCTGEPPSKCGNGKLESGEDCDDGNLLAGDGCSPECEVEVVTEGAIIVSEIMKDPVSVDDAVGEWFELYNTEGFPIDIEGWEFSGGGLEVHVITGGPLVVPSEGFMVLGVNMDTSTNGGIPVDYEVAGISLDNGGDTLVLKDQEQTMIDLVTWDEVTFPNLPGSSLSLHPQYMNSKWNDNGTSWCAATSAINSGEFGTPGAANDLCFDDCEPECELDEKGCVDDDTAWFCQDVKDGCAVLSENPCQAGEVCVSGDCLDLTVDSVEDAPDVVSMDLVESDVVSEVVTEVSSSDQWPGDQSAGTDLPNQLIVEPDDSGSGGSKGVKAGGCTAGREALGTTSAWLLLLLLVTLFWLRNYLPNRRWIRVPMD